MKQPSSPSESGSVLVMAIVFGVIGGITLGSYLTLLQARNVQTHRSLAWNSALTVVEAGIEEAFTHLQADGNNFSANNWSATESGGTTMYWKRRDLPDGSYFYVTNSNVLTPQPVIYSRGFVRAPLKTEEYISRAVRVALIKPYRSFAKAIVVNTTMTFGGTVTLVDSFNSNLGPYTNGVHGTNGSIATNSRLEEAINIQNGNIYGAVTTGPGGTIDIGPNGAVGDSTWNATQNGIQPGWSGDDMNVAFIDNSLPPGVTWYPTLIKGATTLSSGYYALNKTTMSGNDTLTITGKVALWFRDDFNMTGNNTYIRIAPGGSLAIYASATTKFAGQGIINDTGLAANLSYYGLPTNTKLDYAGGSAFIGTVKAPQTAFTVHGEAEIFGAVIADSYTATGNTKFHYDEALKDAKTDDGGLFVLTSYLEQ